MKTKVSFVLFALLFASLFGGDGALSAQAQAGSSQPADLQVGAALTGTTFTYQGQLQDGGQPANGSYDFRFSLYDASIDGNPVGYSLEIGDQVVSQGLFTVNLDFGGVFTGQAIWLEVGVRPGDSLDDYTTLNPRQALTIAPYAAYSLAAPWNGLTGSPPVDILQARVSQACVKGSAIQAIGKDGSVTCQEIGSAGAGDITAVTAGKGLTGGGDNGDVELVISDPYQLPQLCLKGQVPKWNSTSSLWVCGNDANTAYNAGAGLTLSEGQFSVNFAGSGSSNTIARSDHNHLGQIWTGLNNPLKISGSFGSPDYAPLVLSNTASDGLRVNSAGGNGMAVLSASNYGLYVGLAGLDGTFVYSAGSPSTHSVSIKNNGFEIGGAEGNGMYVGRADDDGVYVNSSGRNGIYVGSATSSGVTVNSTNGTGMSIGSAGGTGVSVGTAGQNGLYIGQATTNGIRINSAGQDGVNVYSAGTPATNYVSSANNGFEVGGAEGHGLYVGSADYDGVHVESAYNDGLYIGSAFNGLYVTSADNAGLYVNSSPYGLYVSMSDIGVWADTIHENGYGFYTPDKVYAGSGITFGSLSLIAQVTGADSLSSGDLAAAAGLGEALTDSNEPMPLVQLADATYNSVVGVVEGRMELVPQSQSTTPDEEPEMEMHFVDGPAQPGDYVALRVMGPAQVKVDVSLTAIQTGQRLTASSLAGTARGLQTTTLDGMTVNEGAPVIGTALSQPDENGLVWVLVNPQ